MGGNVDTAHHPHTTPYLTDVGAAAAPDVRLPVAKGLVLDCTPSHSTNTAQRTRW